MVTLQGSFMILSQDALLADKDDIDAMQALLNLIKTKTDSLNNYNDSSLSSTLGQVNDKVTVLGSKVDALDDKVEAKDTFNSTDRTKLNSLSNYNDVSSMGKIDETQASIDSINLSMAKEDTLQQVKTKVNSLINFDDTDIINILNSLPLLPQIKQELVNVNYGRLVIDPTLNKMAIYDKTSDVILAEYMLYDNLGNLNSSRVFRREPL